MFTGIVTAIGRIEELEQKDASLRIRIASPFDDLAMGESIAIDGACLTVVDHAPTPAPVPGSFAVEAVVTTRGRTRFGDMHVGEAVNLERALAVGDRLGGHFVQGHVDGIGDVTAVAEHDDALLIDIRLPPEVAQLSIPHGSIAVSGVSMTINAIPGEATIQLAVIPHTRHHTTLGTLRPGDRVHVEGDMLGKFVRALMRDEG